MAEEETGVDKKWYERLFDMFKMPNLSFGGIFSMVFWGGLLAVVGYFVLKQFPQIGEMLPKELRAWINETTGQEIFKGATEEMIDELPAFDADEKKLTIRKLLVDKMSLDPELAKILTEDQATWDAIKTIVKKHNGGKLTVNGKAEMSTFINDKTVYDLLTTKPDLITKLLNTLPAPKKGEAPTGIPKMVMDAVKTIVMDTDQSRLNTLMSTKAHRDLMCEALAKFSGPVSGLIIDPTALSAFIESTGIKNGTVTPAFKTFLEQTLSGDPAVVGKAAEAYITRLILSDPKAVEALLAGVTVDPAAPNAAALTQMIENAKLAIKDPQTTTAMNNFKTALATPDDPDRASKIIDMLRTSSVADIIVYFDKNPAVFQEVKKLYEGAPNLPVSADMKTGMKFLIESTPHEKQALVNMANNGIDPIDLQTQLKGKDGKIAPEQALDVLMNPKMLEKMSSSPTWQKPLSDIVTLLGAFTKDAKGPEKEAADFLSVRAPAYDLEDAPVNMIALKGLAQAIIDPKKNPKNTDTPEHKARTARVLSGLLGVVTMDATGLKAVNAMTKEDIYQFFREPGNRVAVGAFLKSINTSTLNPEQQKVVAALAANWGNGDHGIAEVLTTEEGAAGLLKGFKEHIAREQAKAAGKASPIKPVDLSGLVGAGKIQLLQTFGNKELGITDGVMKENVPEIIAVLKALGVVQTDVVSTVQYTTERGRVTGGAMK